MNKTSNSRTVRSALLGLMLLGLGDSSRAFASISIEFDYTYDTGNFFNATRRNIMEAVANLFEARIEDTLSPVAPGGSDHWTIQFFNPSSTSLVTVSDPTIAANSIRVYLGARHIGGGVAAMGDYGGVQSSSGSPSFTSAAENRGQTGMGYDNNSSDFAAWGGYISFNSSASWYSDSDPSTLETFTGQKDLYSVAIHEMYHVLGVGSTFSWIRWVNGNHEFTGPATVLKYGANAPLDPNDDSHFQEGLTSTVPGTEAAQEVVLDPTLPTGTRKEPTYLDWTMLKDMGWEIPSVPEPSTFLFVATGAIGLGALMRRHPKPTKTPTERP